MQAKKSGPRGELVTLVEGLYVAVVAPVGAILESLTYAGRDLVMRNPENELMRGFSGAVCAPWVHRIDHGKYAFNGRDYQLPLDSDGLAVNGLLCFRSFVERERTRNSVKFYYRLCSQPGYPFTLQITVAYSLHAKRGLETAVTAENLSSDTAPYSVGGHPYLVAGDEPLAEWKVTSSHTLVQGNLWRSGLAIGGSAGSNFDMREGRTLGDQKLEHAFSGFSYDLKGWWKIAVTAPSGLGVEISSGYWCPWVAMFTRDFPEGRALAIQPSTSPPHAFRNGANLVYLGHGESHTAKWRIRALVYGGLESDCPDSDFEGPPAAFPGELDAPRCAGTRRCRRREIFSNEATPADSTPWVNDDLSSGLFWTGVQGVCEIGRTGAQGLSAIGQTGAQGLSAIGQTGAQGLSAIGQTGGELAHATLSRFFSS